MEAFVLTVLGLVVYFVAIPAVPYLEHESRHRERWRRLRPVPVAEAEPGGPFRGRASEREYLVEELGAPRLVKAVSVVSLVLGHMFIPGLLVGLLGLVAYGLGLLSIPGLVLAAGIYRNAFGLLRCEPEAAAKARRLADFAVVLNVVVMGVASLLMLIDLWGLGLFISVYAVISLLHAEGLRLSAREIDAVHHELAASEAAEASLRAEV